MEWLCWFFGAMVLVTLVGHGIWVAIAKLFPKPMRPTGPRRAIAEPHTDPIGTDVQLAQLLDAGLIDSATYRRVTAALQIARRRGVAKSSASEPKPEPGPAPEPLPAIPIKSVAEPDAVISTWEPSAVDPAPLPDIEPASVQEALPPRPAPPARPAPPRKPLSETFAGFLRDSNIRWGELVGGLLIVGCSVALVISFWGQIAAKPFFQLGLFTSVTTATLALGLYTEHRWKLPTSSRGILLIATMLVPLNFLALAALSHGARVSMIVTAGEVAALGLFGFLVWQASRVLAPYWPELLTSGVVLLSGSLLVTQQFVGARSMSVSLALGVLPVTAYGATIAAMLRRAGRWRQVRARAFARPAHLPRRCPLSNRARPLPAVEPCRRPGDGDRAASVASNHRQARLQIAHHGDCHRHRRGVPHARLSGPGVA
jgi:hypothetical protein